MTATDLSGLAFAFIAVLLFADTSLLRGADQPPTDAARRLSPIDGLRGVLALSVVFYHGVVTEQAKLTGLWDVPSSRAFAHLGPGAVEVFFMITGYLFWGKLLRERGRPDWSKLYVSRLFRIGPTYLLATALMLLVVGADTGWRARVPLGTLAKDIATWLPLGAQTGSPDINGLTDTYRVTAGVAWSLRYEWVFYVALMALSLPARFERRPARWLIAASWAMCVGYTAVRPDLGPLPSIPTAASLFLSGMLAATVPALRLDGTRRHVASAVVLLAVGVSFVPDQTFSSLSVASLALAFYLIVSGCTVFGILTTRAITRVGDVSYPLYLLHGILLWVVLGHALPILPAVLFWPLVAIVAMVAVWCATAAHVAVERPGVALGKVLGRRMGLSPQPSR